MNDFCIEKLLYNFEIELIKKMCVACLQSDKFTDKEKEDIESLLDNTFV
ncbi:MULTISPECIES: hypothetical protein [unclassified Clostridium]|nr:MULTISPECIES: hypothetical protein [unclassified Clostridium]